jgi:hypothetical protein
MAAVRFFQTEAKLLLDSQADDGIRHSVRSPLASSREYFKIKSMFR